MLIETSGGVTVITVDPQIDPVQAVMVADPGATLKAFP
jgi:hypothetical protein